MKRDFDLIRRIVRDIEDMPAGSNSGTPRYEGEDRETVAAHVVLLIEAGLIKGDVLAVTYGLPRIRISGLTWAGHDFLAVAKNDTIWAKAKTSVLAPAAGATWSVILEWMKAESLKAFGLA
jgi:hypothetical protein